MELGLTFPLQRFLRQKPPPYGTEPKGCYCWDGHVISLGGRRSLLAVHCRSRYTFVCYDLTDAQWQALPETFLEGLQRSLLAAGVSENSLKDYLDRAGPLRLTRTHGRREVAFLNRAWEDVLALDYCLDGAAQAQPLLDRAVNDRPSRCAGFGDKAAAAGRLPASLQEGDDPCASSSHRQKK